MNLEQIESHDFQQWNLVADKAKTQIETRLFIDGDFVDAVAGGRRLRQPYPVRPGR